MCSLWLRCRQWDFPSAVVWSPLPQPTVESTFYLDTVLQCHPTALSAPDLAACQAWFAQTYIQMPTVRWQWRINVVTLTTAGPGGCRRKSIQDGIQRYEDTLLGDDLPLFYSDANRGMVAAKDFVLISELSVHTESFARAVRRALVRVTSLTRSPWTNTFLVSICLATKAVSVSSVSPTLRSRL